MDHLVRDAADVTERGPQALVAREDVLETLLQEPDVERALQQERTRHVVGVVRGIELLDEPQSLLRVGQRERALARRARDGGSGRTALERREGAGELLQRGVLEQVAQRHIAPEVLSDA